MGLLKMLFGNKETQTKKTSKSKAQTEKEKRQQERKLWELAEEYDEEE